LAARFNRATTNLDAHDALDDAALDDVAAPFVTVPR